MVKEDDSENDRILDSNLPKVYPIPIREEFKVLTDIDETIDVYSVLGVFVGHYSIKKGETIIQSEHFASGMYYIRFNSSNVSLKVNKI